MKFVPYQKSKEKRRLSGASLRFGAIPKRRSFSDEYENACSGQLSGWGEAAEPLAGVWPTADSHGIKAMIIRTPLHVQRTVT